MDGSKGRSFDAFPVELVEVTLLRLALGSVLGVMGLRPAGLGVTKCSVDIAIVLRLLLILFCKVFIFSDVVFFLEVRSLGV